jgi:uncharacterized protein with PQ loop repeat
MHIGLHHRDLRKRLYKNLEKYPHPDKFKRVFDKFIYVVAFITPIANIPQLFNIWYLRDGSGVSVLSWASFTCISVIWLIYGIIHKEKPIIIMNSLLIFAQGLITIGALIY